MRQHTIRTFLAILAVLLLTPTIALADAPNPIDSQTVGTVKQNTDGTKTLTLAGKWQWNRKCGERIVGWEVSWGDPHQPGNVLTASIAVGAASTQ